MKKILSNSDHEFLNRLKAKDNEAYRILYSKYSAALLGIIRRIVHDANLADDLLKETYIIVYTSIQNFDGACSLFIWMMSIAHKLSFDELAILDKERSLKKNHKAPVLLTGEIAHKLYFDGPIDKVDEDAFVFTMIFYRGYTCAELAEAFDVPAKDHSEI